MRTTRTSRCGRRPQMHLAVVCALALVAASIVAVGAPAHAAEPSVVEITPTQGPATGGTEVLLTGEGLASTTAVHFGTLAASWLRVDPSGNAVTAVAPAQPEGTVVDVTLSVSEGQLPLVAPSPFTYGAARRPFITSLAPGAGPVAGGTVVRIFGSGLYDAAPSVRFGDVAARVTWATDTEVVAVTPPHPTGRVSTVVETAGGTTEARASYAYGSGTWAPAASLNSCAPASPSCTAQAAPEAVLLDPLACHGVTPPAGYPCGHALEIGRGRHIVDVAGKFRSFRDGATEAGSATYRTIPRAFRFRPDDVGRPIAGDNVADGTVVEAVSECGEGACALATLSIPATATGVNLTVRIGELGGFAVRGSTVFRSNPPAFPQAAVGMGIAAGDQLGGVQSLAPGTVVEAVADCIADKCATAILSAPAVITKVGQSLAVSIGTAELYDPDADTWRSTAQPPRVDHGGGFTATLLDGPPEACGVSCGKVLVAGGCCYPFGFVGENALDVAELYDPVTDTWALTKRDDTGEATHLVVPRAFATATTLGDGRVLVAGGRQVGRIDYVHYSAEIYDPAHGSWSAINAMETARAGATATLLNGPSCAPRCGRVLVAGGVGHTHGTCGADEQNVDLPIQCGEVALALAELYDPATGTWAATQRMSADHFDASATLIGVSPCGTNCGKVLVAGGSGSLPRTESELYDPATGTWSQASIGMNRGRSSHTATPLPSGQVLVVSGESADNTAEVYDPVADDWLPAAEMGEGRYGHAAVALDGPACRRSAPPDYCGSVVAVGGYVTATAHDGVAKLGSAEFRSEQVEFRPSDVGKVIEFIDDAGRPAYFANIINKVLGPHAVRLGYLSSVDARGAGFRILRGPDASVERFRPAPRVDVVAPSRAEAGQEVTITGVGFAGASAVRFGGVAAAEVVVHSTTRLTATAPPHVPGVVDVVVTNAGGDSAPSPAARFTYLASGSGAASVDPAPPVPPCVALPAPAVGQVAYPAGYSLVGLPAGTSLPTFSPRYAWTNQGADGRYAILAPDQRLDPGQGAWAYFSCPALVSLGAPGATAPLRLALGAYRASIVANPTAAPAPVSGFDHAARFDPGLNSGRGGYRISAYRQPQTLAVGEAIWVFSFTDTTVVIGTEAPAPTPTRPVRRRG